MITTGRGAARAGRSGAAAGVSRPTSIPLRCQLGGSDPAAALRPELRRRHSCADFGYDEINLNVGLPVGTACRTGASGRLP